MLQLLARFFFIGNMFLKGTIKEVIERWTFWLTRGSRGVNKVNMYILVFLLTSSGSTSHFAAVMYICTPEPCDITIGRG